MLFWRPDVNVRAAQAAWRQRESERLHAVLLCTPRPKLIETQYRPSSKAARLSQGLDGSRDSGELGPWALGLKGWHTELLET